MQVSREPRFYVFLTGNEITHGGVEGRGGREIIKYMYYIKDSNYTGTRFLSMLVNFLSVSKTQTSKTQTSDHENSGHENSDPL